jgi:hypothetical protein
MVMGFDVFKRAPNPSNAAIYFLGNFRTIAIIMPPYYVENQAHVLPHGL